MLLQITKTVNSSCFPVKCARPSQCGLGRTKFYRVVHRLALVITILLSISFTNCRMIDKTPIPATSQNSNQNDPLEIHARAITIDMHADTAQRLVDEKVNLAQRLPQLHLKLHQRPALRMRCFLPTRLTALRLVLGRCP